MLVKIRWRGKDGISTPYLDPGKVTGRTSKTSRSLAVHKVTDKKENSPKIADVVLETLTSLARKNNKTTNKK